MNKIAGIAVVCMFMLCFTGCMSSRLITVTTVTYDKKSGKPVSRVVDSTFEKNYSPLKRKAVAIGGSGWNFKISSGIDPTTGTPMPNINFRCGDAFFADIPVVAEDNPDVNFEMFYYEKSAWSYTPAVVRYMRTGGGKGSNAIPAIRLLLNIDNIKIKPANKKVK